MAFDLHLEFWLSGKPSRVMQLLTDPVLIRKWSGEEGVAEPRVGGRFEMFDGWVTGTVQKATTEELSVTWLPENWPKGAEPSVVNFILKARDGGTTVYVDHTGLPTEAERDSHKTGWADFYFDPMEDFIMMVDKN